MTVVEIVQISCVKTTENFAKVVEKKQNLTKSENCSGNVTSVGLATGCAECTTIF